MNILAWLVTASFLTVLVVKVAWIRQGVALGAVLGSMLHAETLGELTLEWLGWLAGVLSWLW